MTILHQSYKHGFLYVDCLPTEVPTTQTPIPYSFCHRNDFLPQPSCNKYLDCTEKIPIQMECPVGLHFNPTTRVCDWPFKAECGEFVFFNF